MHHTVALMLGKEEWREADLLVSAFSRDFGRIRLLAQGVRKHGAKLQGHLEPGVMAEISFVVAKNGYRLTTAKSEDVFPNTGESFSKLRARAFILHLLEANLWEDGKESARLFELTHAVLLALDRAERLSRVRRLVSWFRIHLLLFLGILPPSDAPEARDLGALFSLAAAPLTELDQVAISEDTVEQGLERLNVRLGRALSGRASVAFADSTIY